MKGTASALISFWFLVSDNFCKKPLTQRKLRLFLDYYKFFFPHLFKTFSNTAKNRVTREKNVCNAQTKEEKT